MASINSTITIEVSSEAKEFLKKVEEVFGKLNSLLEKALEEIEKQNKKG
jgi:hypothetical protein